MEISIEDHQLPYDTHNLYDVTFFTHQIHTLLTHTPSLVDQWLTQVLNKIPQGTQPVIVGLDVEWLPNCSNIENPVAILQLCIGDDCLIYQLLYSPSVPDSLSNFLSDESYTFVGVSIESDAEKLVEDYGLSVAKMVDLRGLAAEKLGIRELKKAGLKRLSKEVLGKEVEKPKKVTLSRWDNEWLTPAQVQYACLDVFLSYEIGKELNATATVLNNVGIRTERPFCHGIGRHRSIKLRRRLIDISSTQKKTQHRDRIGQHGSTQRPAARRHCDDATSRKPQGRDADG